MDNNNNNNKVDNANSCIMVFFMTKQNIITWMVMCVVVMDGV